MIEKYLQTDLVWPGFKALKVDRNNYNLNKTEYIYEGLSGLGVSDVLWSISLIALQLASTILIPIRFQHHLRLSAGTKIIKL